MWFSIAGTLNSIFIVISLWGIWAQVKKVWDRKKNPEESGSTTQLLSLNQFSVSFLAYWSFFVYGYSMKPFNHFIVWPRLFAAVLVLVLLFEMARDRKTTTTKTVAGVASLMMLLGVCGLLFGRQFVDEGRIVSQVLIVTITGLLAQGYAHQIKLILDSGSTGAVSIKMSQFILAMDVTTIFFALVMGLHNGWPLLLLASVSAATKLMMMYLFYWVRVSPVAGKRRIEKQAVSV
ncbi:MAG: hypothetical protein KGM99_04175 [Burkholderiales bacterium]|nr:hypothetical protein [Burkholderiales bacterium]